MRVASQLLVAATAAAIVTPPVAGAAETSPNWEQEAQAPAPETPHFTTYSAQGLTWAPGGTAASNSIYVKGQGTHVE